MRDSAVMGWFGVIALVNGVLTWASLRIRSWLWPYLTGAIGEEALPVFTLRSYYVPYALALVFVVATFCAVIVAINRLPTRYAIHVALGLLCIDVMLLGFIVVGLAGPAGLLAELVSEAR